MTLERSIAGVFAMDETAWRRHANPWSVWTRVATLPLLVCAAWSRVRLSWWALGPIAVVMPWTWMNPRLLSEPRSTNNWASKGVMGERVWLNRDRAPVPPHRRPVPNILVTVSGVGVLFLAWGLVELAVWPTLLGMAVVFPDKLWFVDRMVWLDEEMKGTASEYRGWEFRDEAITGHGSAEACEA